MRRWVGLGCCASILACCLAACGESAPKRVPAARSTGAERPAARRDEGPPRLRFTHFPRTYPNFRIAASRIDFRLTDPRSGVRAPQPRRSALAIPADGEVVAVGLPPGFAALVQERLTRVASGRGRELTLVIEIRKLAASRDGALRRVDVAFDFTVLDAGDRSLLRGHGQAGKHLEGPPIDDGELDELHRAACADALDDFLASETNIALVNEVMASH